MRAILKKGWLDDDGRVNASAFIRDARRDPDGLSVNMQALTEIESWLSTFSGSFGADTLHTGRVRDLQLEIGQDERDLQEGQGHALIVGVPSLDEDAKRAEDMATALRNLSRIADRNRRKR